MNSLQVKKMVTLHQCERAMDGLKRRMIRCHLLIILITDLEKHSLRKLEKQRLTHRLPEDTLEATYQSALTLVKVRSGIATKNTCKSSKIVSENERRPKHKRLTEWYSERSRGSSYVSRERGKQREKIESCNRCNFWRRPEEAQQKQNLQLIQGHKIWREHLPSIGGRRTPRSQWCLSWWPIGAGQH